MDPYVRPVQPLATAQIDGDVCAALIEVSPARLKVSYATRVGCAVGSSPRRDLINPRRLPEAKLVVCASEVARVVVTRLAAKAIRCRPKDSRR